MSLFCSYLDLVFFLSHYFALFVIFALVTRTYPILCFYLMPPLLSRLYLFIAILLLLILPYFCFFVSSNCLFFAFVSPSSILFQLISMPYFICFISEYQIFYLWKNSCQFLTWNENSWSFLTRPDVYRFLSSYQRHLIERWLPFGGQIEVRRHYYMCWQLPDYIRRPCWRL